MDGLGKQGSFSSYEIKYMEDIVTRFEPFYEEQKTEKTEEVQVDLFSKEFLKEKNEWINAAFAGVASITTFFTGTLAKLADPVAGVGFAGFLVGALCVAKLVKDGRPLNINVAAATSLVDKVTEDTPATQKVFFEMMKYVDETLYRHHQVKIGGVSVSTIGSLLVGIGGITSIPALVTVGSVMAIGGFTLSIFNQMITPSSKELMEEYLSSQVSPEDQGAANALSSGLRSLEKTELPKGKEERKKAIIQEVRAIFTSPLNIRCIEEINSSSGDRGNRNVLRIGSHAFSTGLGSRVVGPGLSYSPVLSQVSSCDGHDFQTKMEELD